MRASLFQKAMPERRKSLDESDAATSKEVSSGRNSLILLFTLKRSPPSPNVQGMHTTAVL
jgi:hypothetical protein